MHSNEEVTKGHLAIFAMEVHEIIHMYVKQSRTGFVDRPNHVSSGTSRMPDVDAAPKARIHTPYRLQYIQRRRPYLVFRSVIVDRDMDVVLLYELFDSRQSVGLGGA